MEFNIKKTFPLDFILLIDESQIDPILNVPKRDREIES